MPRGPDRFAPAGGSRHTLERVSESSLPRRSVLVGLLAAPLTVAACSGDKPKSSPSSSSHRRPVDDHDRGGPAGQGHRTRAAGRPAHRDDVGLRGGQGPGDPGRHRGPGQARAADRGRRGQRRGRHLAGHAHRRRRPRQRRHAPGEGLVLGGRRWVVALPQDRRRARGTDPHPRGRLGRPTQPDAGEVPRRTPCTSSAWTTRASAGWWACPATPTCPCRPAAATRSTPRWSSAGSAAWSPPSSGPVACRSTVTSSPGSRASGRWCGSLGGIVYVSR